MSYAERLAKALDAAGLNQSELARALGITTASVSNIMTGASKSMAADNSVRAAKLLNVSPYWLATGQGPMRPAGTSPLATRMAAEFDRLVPDSMRERVYAQVMGLIEIAACVDRTQEAPTSTPPKP